MKRTTPNSKDEQKLIFDEGRQESKSQRKESSKPKKEENKTNEKLSADSNSVSFTLGMFTAGIIMLLCFAAFMWGLNIGKIQGYEKSSLEYAARQGIQFLRDEQHNSGNEEVGK